jgi:hypothetical protein
VIKRELILNRRNTATLSRSPNHNYSSNGGHDCDDGVDLNGINFEKIMHDQRRLATENEQDAEDSDELFLRDDEEDCSENEMMSKV